MALLAHRVVVPAQAAGAAAAPVRVQAAVAARAPPASTPARSGAALAGAAAARAARVIPPAGQAVLADQGIRAVLADQVVRLADQGLPPAAPGLVVAAIRRFP